MSSSGSNSVPDVAGKAVAEAAAKAPPNADDNDDDFFAGWVAGPPTPIDDVPPLFADALPEDYQDKPEWAALNSLMFEGKSPEELVQRYKELGNESFQEGPKQYLHALKYYTDALEQKVEDNKLNSALLSNRAAVNLKLGNHGRVMEDAKVALDLNPGNVKAAYRGCVAARRVGKPERAIRFAQAGLLADPENAQLKHEVVQAGKERQAAMAAQAKRMAEKKKRATLKRELAARGVTVGSHRYQGVEQARDAEIVFQPGEGVVYFPVFFMYPEFGQSDFIAAAAESSTIVDHLSVMLSPDQPPAPWDMERRYTPDSVSVYYITHEVEPEPKPEGYVAPYRKWKRVDPSMTIAAIVGSEDCIIPGFPTLYVMQRGSAFEKTHTAKPLDD